MVNLIGVLLRMYCHKIGHRQCMQDVWQIWSYIITRNNSTNYICRLAILVPTLLLKCALIEHMHTPAYLPVACVLFAQTASYLCRDIAVHNLFIILFAMVHFESQLNAMHSLLCSYLCELCQPSSCIIKFWYICLIMQDLVNALFINRDMHRT